jgi:hypothetical protein
MSRAGNDATDTIALSPKLVTSTDTSNTPPFCVVPGIVMARVRKVRNFRLELICSVPAAFGLVYFPEGINPKSSKLKESLPDTLARLYPPEQHIMTSCICRDNAVTIVKAYGTRSLSNNDTIYLLARPFIAPQEDTNRTARITILIAFW